MARLPIPGSDNQAWGTILNQYLTVSHTADGSLKQVSAILIAASDASDDAKAVAAIVCAGVDDHLAIQQAIDSLPDDGGKIILSEGTFYIGATLRIENDNVNLEGAGAGERANSIQTGAGTRLLATLGLSEAVLRVQRTANNRPVYGTLLRDFTIDGNQVGSEVDGVHFRSNRAHIDHIHVRRCTGNGIRVHGYASWQTYDTELVFCQAGDNALHNFLFDTHSPDAHIIGCIGYRSGLDNFHFKTASLQLTNCHFYGANRYNIYFNNSGSRTKIVNCKIENAGQHGVMIDSGAGTGAGDIQIVGCNLKSNGRSAENQFDHIHITGSSSAGITRTLIVANAFSWINFNSGGNRPRYGINLDGPAAQQTLVLGNTFGPDAHFGTAQVRDAGSNSLPSMIRHNVNWITENSGEATVPSAATSVVVAHGLDGVPQRQHISLTPTNSMGNASKFWLSDVTTDSFTIRVDVAPTGAGASFAWQAAVL